MARMLLRASTILLTPAIEEETQLQTLAESSSALWNIANYQRRKAFYQHSKIPTYAAQCKSLKKEQTFESLGTCKSQALLQKLDESWRSFWALNRLAKQGRLPSHNRKLSPPGYWKHNGIRDIRGFYIRNDGWSMDEKAVSISRALKIPYKCGQLWVGKQGRLEVEKDRLKGKWYAHIPVEVSRPQFQSSSTRKASLDLGICNLATLYMENETPIIYSGRAVLSDWIYRAKNIASRQSNLPKRKRTSKKIQVLFRQRTRRLNHAVNAMLRDIFELLESKDIGELFIGDLNGIRTEANHGDNGNQKLHNFWIFNMIAGRIYELGEE
jgi:putative transposase